MRRTLFVLALLPGAVFAQTVASQLTSPASSTATQLTNGVRAVGYGAEAGYAVAPNGPVTGDQIRAQTEAANSRQRNQDQTNAQAQAAEGDQALTAAAQGYKADTRKADAQTLADYQALHTPRQMGQVVSQPGPFRPVATDKAAAGWYANWAYTLQQIGVPEGKIRFEAARLDRETFGAWANRQMMATDSFNAIDLSATP